MTQNLKTSKRVTILDHPEAADCPEGMACKICMQVCYDGWRGHFFDHPTGQCPCECGQFKDIREAEKFFAKERGDKSI